MQPICSHFSSRWQQIAKIFRKNAAYSPQMATVNFLLPQQIVSVRHAKGYKVWLLEGALWLTETGDRHDHMLYPGQLYQIRSQQMVVLQPLAGMPTRWLWL